MKEKVAAIWQQYKDNLLSITQAVEQIKDVIGFHDKSLMSDLVINTSEDPVCLDVVVEEDSVIFTIGLSELEQYILAEHGVPEV